MNAFSGPPSGKISLQIKFSKKEGVLVDISILNFLHRLNDRVNLNSDFGERWNEDTLD